MKKLTFTLLFTLMAIVSAQAAKVYLKVAGFVTDNNTLTAYAWKPGTEDRLLGDWPGTKMALETIGADKYYVCEFDYDGEYSIIFKGTVYDKEQQSIDLTGNIGDCTFVANDNWTTDGKWSCDKTEGAPSAETPVETYTVQLAGNAYGTGWDAPVTFAYNAETKEYVYEETETAKLADEFKINIVETNAWLSNNVFENAALNNELGFQDLYGDNKNMKITDAADYDKITLTVKKEGETWKMKIVGEKTYTVQIKGVNYDNWGVNAPAFTYNAETGEYVYEETEETAKLADMFKIYVKEGDRWISNAKFSGALNNDLGYQDLNEGDVMKITDAADYDKITLTVKNDNGTWKLKIVGEKTDKTSSVAGVDAAGVVIAAANGEIVVDGAQSVAVYTAAGALVSTDARTRVAAGLYIVRADNVVKKVIVK